MLYYKVTISNLFNNLRVIGIWYIFAKHVYLGVSNYYHLEINK